MKKALVLLVLLATALAGPALAVTCAYDNVPAGTLLVPYFRVSRNGSTGGDIGEGGTDTLLAITNVSATGIIVHATIYTKYSFPVLDFNIPLTGYDVAFFRMKDVLNGKLNVNPLIQNPARLPNDPCGLNTQTGVYAPPTGFGPTTYTRFPNPDATDAGRSISIYSVPAFSGSFRTRVWDSLDESGDVTSFTSPGANILDADNGGCGIPGDGSYAGDFSGYITLDVVNYCTNYFPTRDAPFYTNDAIATVGWTQPAIGYYYTPNTIIGDIFYIDPATGTGNISGDPMVALEFDSRLNWNTAKTFFGRHNYIRALEPPAGLGVTAPVAYQFFGDGREPLGEQYAFRYLSDAANGLRSWAIIWRGDVVTFNDGIPTPNLVTDTLCNWYQSAVGAVTGSPQSAGFGFHDSIHAVVAFSYDNDENSFVTGGVPSGGSTSATIYVFLESQRISLLGNGDINPGGFSGGWINMRLPGYSAAALGLAYNFNQAYVGIQHSGPGLALSVGHSAALMNKNQFLCSPALYSEAGNVN